MPRRNRDHKESVRIRCAYFDEAGKAHKISSAQLSRLCDRDNEEVMPKLAGQRGKFVTLWVAFEGKVATAVRRVDGMVIDFAADGKVDREKFATMDSIAMEYVWEGRDRPDGENVIPSAARFAYRQYQWKPTREDVQAALVVHGIR